MNKLLFLFVLAFIAPPHLSTYSQMPDPLYSPPSNSSFYYKNQGQMLDNLGNVRNDILFYTERTYPGIVVMEDTISFWDYILGDTASIGAIDTFRRIDMSFVCKSDRNNVNQVPLSCGDILEYEESSDHLNYYLPHCGVSGITNVKGYARIVYENVFPNINFHL